eukprot:gene51-32_t
MDILPSSHTEFSSKAYWEKFFQLRGQESFEWYGSFQEIYPLLQRSLFPDVKVLVIGCGNSNFSSDLYDQGYQSIVNVDFSELVIQEMKIKNMFRSEMQWDIGDMTDMHMYDAASFDVVVDKGALDALMSTPTPELREKAKKMFEEIQRVLKPNGKYVCISLAEDYVFAELSKFFVTSSRVADFDWKVDIERISSQKPSPFIPFVFTIQKAPLSSRPPSPTIFVDSLGNVLSAGQSLAANEVAPSIKHMQDFQELRFKLNKVEVGRFETVQLWAGGSDIPRFSVYVLDVSMESTLACAVFFIPTGRESDYQFTTHEGLIDIAFQANCRRLIAVSCNRPHVFPEMNELQSELSPFMMALAPGDRDVKQQIPYMAINVDSDWEVIAEGTSALSGSYVVEEKEDEDGRSVYRRLVFLQNQQLVQSECRLVATAATNNKSKDKKGKKNAKKPSAAKKAVETAATVAASSSSSSDYRLDVWYVDELYKSMLACLNIVPQGRLPRRALIVGLGGGSLVMVLQRLVPGIVIDAVELDSVVVDVAHEHFGFTSGSHTHVHVADGVQFMMNRASEVTSTGGKYDLIVIDADSKDTSIGLSAPPRSFLQSTVLQTMWNTLLEDNGLLMFNVVARSKERLTDFYETMKTELTGARRGFRVKPSEETVNLVVAYHKAVADAASSSSTAATTVGGKKNGKTGSAMTGAHRAMYESLRLWIQVRFSFLFFWCK